MSDEPPKSSLFHVTAQVMAIINTVVLVVVGVLVAMGKTDQADLIKRLVPIVVSEVQQQTPTPIPSIPVSQDVAPPAAVSPEQIKQLAELFKVIVEIIQKERSKDTTPDTDVKPDTIPKPDTKPGPVPKPTSLGISVFDQNRIPIESNTVPANRWFRVTAVGVSSEFRLDVDRHGEFQGDKSGDGREITGSLSSGYVDFTLTDWVAKQRIVSRIYCNQGPQPPPNPDPVPDPDITPIPQPDKTTGDRRALILFDSNSKTATDAQKAALGSMKLRELLDSRCVQQADGTTGWRKWSVETDVTRELAPWPELFAQVKGQVQSVPSIALIRGKTIVLKPITDEASTLAFVEAWK